MCFFFCLLLWRKDCDKCKWGAAIWNALRRFTESQCCPARLFGVETSRDAPPEGIQSGFACFVSFFSFCWGRLVLFGCVLAGRLVGLLCASNLEHLHPHPRMPSSVRIVKLLIPWDDYETYRGANWKNELPVNAFSDEKHHLRRSCGGACGGECL